MTRISIVDDHPVVQRSVSAVLSADTGMEIVGTHGTGEQALKGLETTPTDVLILDLSLPGLDGLELVRRISEEHPAVGTLVFSMHDEALYAERVLAAGARGYVGKRESLDTLLVAVREVAAGGVYLSSAMRRQVLDRSDRPVDGALGRLTNRELEVLRGIGEGRSTRELAELMSLSVKTVESYRANLKHKLSLENGSALVRYAVHWLAKGDD